MCSSATSSKEQTARREKIFNEENLFFIKKVPPLTYFPDNLKNFDLEIQGYFPKRSDRWVIIAFYVVFVAKNEDNQHEANSIVGATGLCLERITTNMKYQHMGQMWGRLWKYVISFGKVKLFHREDLWMLFFDSSIFRKAFWYSMRAMIKENLIIQEERKIEEEKTNIYYPSKELVTMLNSIPVISN